MVEEPFVVPLLLSYAHLRNNSPKKVDALLNDDRARVLLDSGAFTAFNTGTPVTLDEYLRFLERYADRLDGYIALDVIQDPVATQRNLDEMITAGFRPIPVHIFGDDDARMDELFAISDWVALAGLRRPHRGVATKPYVVAKHDMAKGRRVHWLGYCAADLLKRCRPFSADSSSWAYGRMYGYSAFYLGRGVLRYHYYPDVREKRLYLKPEYIRAVSEVGIDVAKLTNPDFWKGRKECVNELPMRSWVRFAADCERNLGTRIYIAVTDTEQADVAIEGRIYA